MKNYRENPSEKLHTRFVVSPSSQYHLLGLKVISLWRREWSVVTPALTVESSQTNAKTTTAGGEKGKEKYQKYLRGKKFFFPLFSLSCCVALKQEKNLVYFLAFRQSSGRVSKVPDNKLEEWVRGRLLRVKNRCLSQFSYSFLLRSFSGLAFDIVKIWVEKIATVARLLLRGVEWWLVEVFFLLLFSFFFILQNSIRGERHWHFDVGKHLRDFFSRVLNDEFSLTSFEILVKSSYAEFA